LWALLLCLAVFIGVGRWQEVPIGAVTDDAYYIEMARSLAEGLGPVIATGPDTQPANPQIFPLGFPLLLSPIARLAPHSLSALSLIPLCAALVTLFLIWHLSSPTTNRRLRLMVILATMLNPWFISWSSRILSDLPYMALSLGVLLVFLKADEQDFRSKKTLLWLVLLCAAAISVRTIGWALVIAISATLITQRRWWISLGLPVWVAVALIVPWVMSDNTTGPLTSAYANQMFSRSGGDLWQIIAINTTGYIAQIPVLILPIFSSAVAQIFGQRGLSPAYVAASYFVGIGALALIGRGLIAGSRLGPQATRNRLMFFYILAYAIALSIFDGYPSGVQTRLVLPLLPIFIWLILEGAGKLNQHFPKWIFAALIVTSLIHNGWRIAHPLRTTIEASGHGLVDPGEGAHWLIKNSQATDIVMTKEPLTRHIHWQRPVISFPTSLTVQSIGERCTLYAVSYIFVGPSVSGEPRQLDGLNAEMKRILGSNPQRFEPVWKDDTQSIFIYRVLP